MKVLVTGANGYIGQYLCRQLVNAKYEVTALTRQPFVVAGAAQYLSKTFSLADLTDALREQELVIHLAARAHQPEKRNAQTYAIYKAINVDKTIDLARSAIAAGVKRFIYLSSIKVNGEETFNTPFRATDNPNPQDFYGKTKWEAEQALIKICAEGGIELVIIRSPLVWGETVKGNLNSIVKLINYRIPLPFRNVRNRRDLVSLENLSSLILRCIDHPSASNKVFLVSDGVPRSTAEIIDLVSSQARFRPRLITCPLSILLACRYIPGLGNKINKLMGNLEIDISETCKTLEWQPKSRDAEPGAIFNTD